jgi:carbon-monoxide dehydrogenase large subunit
MGASMQYGRFGSGNAVRRVEDESLLTGRGNFTDDVNAPGQAHVLFLRSTYPHARIVTIDGSAAAQMPGVIAVVTGPELAKAGVKPLPSSTDFRRVDGSPTAAPPRYALAVDTVRFVGEAVAAVVAETRAQARDALEAIEVDYEPLPVVIDPVAAVGAGSPLVWPVATNNIAAEIRHGDVTAATKAFDAAAHVVALDLVNQRLAPSPIEPRAVLATYDAQGDRLTLRVSSQTPTGLRDALCDPVLGIAADKVRVLVGDVGGGFGMKTGLYPEDVVLAYCARKLNRPLKWCAERIDEMLAASHGRDVTSKAELALDASGRVLALRVSSLANLGAYATPAGRRDSTVDRPVGVDEHLRHPAHRHPHSRRPHPHEPDRRLPRRRTAGSDLHRRAADGCRSAQAPAGSGRTAAAEHDPPSQMPYRNPMDKTYDSGNFESVMDQAMILADWNGFDARRAESSRRGRLRGRGMAAFLEWTGADVFEEQVTVTVSADGYVEIFSATQAMGQGLATTYAQLAVDVFDVPLERIRIVQGDTDRGTGFGSAGSRSLFVGGSAVRVASERTVKHAQDLAATALEAAATDIEYAVGAFTVVGTDRRIGLFELASREPQREIRLVSVSKVADSTWPNGCHICEVEIDPDTGHVAIVGYASVNDVGRVVNPLIVIGQLDGGAVQGHRPGALRELRLRPRDRPGTDRLVHGLRAAAIIHRRRVQYSHGRIHSLPQQRVGCEGCGRARYHRRNTRRSQRSAGCARARRRRQCDRQPADASHERARLACAEPGLTATTHSLERFTHAIGERTDGYDHDEGRHDDLLQGLGRRSAHRLPPRMAIDGRRLGRADDVLSGARLSRHCPRSPGPWPFFADGDGQRDGHVRLRCRRSRRPPRPQERDSRGPLDRRRRSDALCREARQGASGEGRADRRRAADHGQVPEKSGRHADRNLRRFPRGRSSPIAHSSSGMFRRDPFTVTTGRGQRCRKASSTTGGDRG